MKYLLEYVCVKAINIDGSIEIKYLPFLILKYILMLDYGQTIEITGLGTWTKTIPVILCSTNMTVMGSHIGKSWNKI